MNRLVRIRMLGGVGAEGENPSATRFTCLPAYLNGSADFYQVHKLIHFVVC